MAESLREELLTIPGIAEAEVEGTAEVPAGVRVRLEHGADPDAVGREVQRVLATHGMRSQMTSSLPPPPPGAERASVVSLPGVPAFETAPSLGAAPDEAPEPPRGAEESAVTADQAASPLPTPPAGPPATEGAPAPPGVPGAPGAMLASVSVEEGRAGMIVRASSTDGRAAARRARASESGLDEAVVAVVAELVGPAGTPPLLVTALEQEVAGTSMITVVIEIGEGARAVGAAVLEGGRAYAVARATWAALSALG